jgi:hypothetical protein
MMVALDTFLDELRADRDLAAHADAVETALEALDIEADGNPHALQAFEAACWIIKKPTRTTEEKIFALTKLFSLPGAVTVNMRELLPGW